MNKNKILIKAMKVKIRRPIKVKIDIRIKIIK